MSPALWQIWEKGGKRFLVRRWIEETGQFRLQFNTPEHPHIYDKTYLVAPDFFDDATFVKQMSEPEFGAIQ